jgi:hypothetical protein
LLKQEKAPIMTKKLEAIITHQKGAQNASQEYQINH